MKTLKPDDLKTLVRPGRRIFIGGGAACPRALLEAGQQALLDTYDLEVVHGSMLGPPPWEGPLLHRTRLGYEPSAADYVPVRPSEVPSLFREGWLALDCAMVMVAPPDRLGYCSLGVQVEASHAACRRATLVVAQINPKMPRTAGGGFVHTTQIEFAIEVDAPLPEQVFPFPSARMQRIGAYAAEWIADGATLHAHFHPTAQAVLDQLHSHRRLGVHTHTMTDAIQRLIESGAADNSRKSGLAGQSVATCCLGSTALYAFVHDNPHIGLFPVEEVCDPRVVADQPGVTCIHSPDAVSLGGEAALPFADDFLVGAAQRTGGMILACLTATGTDENVSQILPELPPHGASYLPDAIVTEHGAALLKGRSFREKAQEILRVVHPDRREGLLRAARERKLLPPYWSLPPPYDPEQGGFRDRRVHLRDGVYLMRLLTPADEDRLQEFFYSHTEETVHMRYGFTLRRMTRKRAFELVSVDQNRDLALGIFETRGPRQVLHAVGRYYLDPQERNAEVAFVTRETKRQSGMARALLQALIETARNRGLESLWGQVDRDNLPMLRLFQKCGAQTRSTAGDGSLNAVITLNPPAGAL